MNQNKQTQPTKSNFSIKSSQRVLLTGKTGSGKSTLAQYLLFPVHRLIVIDGKDGMDNDNWNLTNYSRADLRKIENGEPVRTRLVANIPDIIEALNVAYATGNIIIYIDEVTVTIPPQTKPPQIIQDIATRGRSRNVGLWSATQRPTQIPLFLISEAEQIFIFTLNLVDDRKRMYNITGDKRVLNKPVDTYGFYYYNLESGNLRYYAKLKI